MEFAEGFDLAVFLHMQERHIAKCRVEASRMRRIGDWEESEEGVMYGRILGKD